MSSPRLDARFASWVVPACIAALVGAATAWIAAPRIVASAMSPAMGERAEPSGALAAEVERIGLALERETMRAEAIEAELALMRTVVEQLAANRAEGGDSDAEGATDGEGEAHAREAASGLLGGGPRFEEGLLRALGLVEDEVADLRERWDEAQLERLELRDRATREGWVFRPRFRDEQANVDARLREDLGEEDYDRLLYATQQPNRVVVRQVIGGSAAADAGIQPGDIILSYAGARMHRPMDLSAATASGVRGERVAIVIERQGRRETLTAPRGPLGVSAAPISAQPR